MGAFSCSVSSRNFEDLRFLTTKKMCGTVQVRNLFLLMSAEKAVASPSPEADKKALPKGLNPFA
jgi:hypothetical protein